MPMLQLLPVPVLPQRLPLRAQQVHRRVRHQVLVLQRQQARQQRRLCNL